MRDICCSSKANPEDCDPGWVVHSYDAIFAENKDKIEKSYIVIYETDDYIIYQKSKP